MLGKSVVCPDCGTRIEVPFQSDPRAETLYQRMKQSQSGQTVPHSEFSAHSEPPVQQSISKQKSRPGLPDPTSTPSVKIEQIDDWIEKLWTDIPDSDVVSDARRYHAPLPNTGSQPADETKSSPSVYGHPGFFRWVAAMFVAAFLIGIGCGIILRPFVASERSTVSDSGQLAAVNGKLTFETPDERQMPDADAVVIFLPIANIPTIPFSGRGLRLQDGMETVAEPSDVIQQITELGGKYVPVDIEGRFSFSVEKDGRYLGILISSHAIRPAEANWNLNTDKNLRRFFREPTELLGDYRFLCEEYELKRGETLSVQHNFSR